MPKINQTVVITASLTLIALGAYKKFISPKVRGVLA